MCAQMSSAVSNGLGFASYETGLSFYRHFSAGASPAPAERGVIAGVAATIVMAAIQPLEVIMRRMQVRAAAQPTKSNPCAACPAQHIGPRNNAGRC